MKRNLIILALFLFATTAFSQKEEKNGTIYIKHPYIDAVKNSAEAYLAKDDATNRKIYADTATFWVSGMPKQIKIEEAFKMWATDFDYYTDVKQTPVGYPDYLHYKDKDLKYVQSWWQWSGKSKKTGEVIKINFVQFDLFNKDGKITDESLYGDFSKMVKE
jgi:hypothetical protein